MKKSENAEPLILRAIGGREHRAMSRKLIAFVFGVLLPALCAGLVTASAADQLMPTEAFKFSSEKRMGWTPAANVGVNAAFSSQSDVVGQTNGTSETLGLNARSSYNYAHDTEEWQNGLLYIGSATKTPNLPVRVKSGDELKFESLYLYGIPSLPDVGPYARFSAKAPVFKGEDVRQAKVVYKTKYVDGPVRERTDGTYPLSKGFVPLTTHESVGGFWKAVDNGKVRFDTRLGLGAEQISANGQFAVTGTNDDGSVNVNQLRSVSQVGVEAAVSAKGVIDQKTGWSAGVEVLLPFASNKPADDKRKAFQLANVEGFAKFTSNLTDWASLSYDYRLMIQPQLVDRAQQTHMLVLNVSYNLF